jgi:hypothetical protein
LFDLRVDSIRVLDRTASIAAARGVRREIGVKIAGKPRYRRSTRKIDRYVLDVGESSV